MCFVVYYRDFLFLKIVWGISIIMLQKVAAIVNKVAADLCFRASKVRLLLHKKFFEFAASSAATLKYRNSLRYAQKSYKSKLT